MHHYFCTCTLKIQHVNIQIINNNPPIKLIIKDPSKAFCNDSVSNFVRLVNVIPPSNILISINSSGNIFINVYIPVPKKAKLKVQ